MPIYDFVRNHIIPFNAVIVMSVTVASVLDFLAPQAPYLAMLSYFLAVLVAIAMLLEAINQRALLPEEAWPNSLLKRLRPPPGPIWEAPGWQVVAVIAIIAVVLGQVSKAQASSGGLIASSAPNLRNVQLLLLGIKEDTRRIQTTLDGMGRQVDSIHTLVGGIESSLKSPLDYLLEGDYPFLKNYVASGKRLPSGESYLVLGLNQKRDDRFDLLQLYSDNGYDLLQAGSLIALTFSSIAPMDNITIKNVKKLDAWAVKNLKNYSGNFFYRCNDLTLLDYSYIADDKKLSQWLILKGANPDEMHTCDKGSEQRNITAKEIQAILSK